MTRHDQSTLPYDWRFLLILLAIFLALYVFISYLILTRIGVPRFEQYAALLIHG